ncbi:hypothetical protein VZT92_020672 [Zoarces viviparus]|uniref:Uncharacterized protein n=1 Tax=Zoarces viviparus TaxID=48416 RepID=A0AAW1EF45_ZOAVI
MQNPRGARHGGAPAEPLLVFATRSIVRKRMFSSASIGKPARQVRSPSSQHAHPSYSRIDGDVELLWTEAERRER